MHPVAHRRALPDPQDDALLRLLDALRQRGYRFVTPTPATHARVVARADRREARTLTDILGWSLPFRDGVTDAEIVSLLEQAGALETANDGLRRSKLRVSSLGQQLYLHSAYPTEAKDAVFFGPDSYRFAQLIETEIARQPPPAGGNVVDIGTGAGVGAIVAGALCPGAKLTMTDINPKALRLARINACAAGIDAAPLLAEDLDAIEGPLALVLANPPYIADDGDRAYRDGGGMFRDFARHGAHGHGAAGRRRPDDPLHRQRDRRRRRRLASGAGGGRPGCAMRASVSRARSGRIRRGA